MPVIYKMLYIVCLQQVQQEAHDYQTLSQTLWTGPHLLLSLSWSLHPCAFQIFPVRLLVTPSRTWLHQSHKGMVKQTEITHGNMLPEQNAIRL